MTPAETIKALLRILEKRDAIIEALRSTSPQGDMKDQKERDASSRDRAGGKDC
jgi:hypothetical protein